MQLLHHLVSLILRFLSACLISVKHALAHLSHEASSGNVLEICVLLWIVQGGEMDKGRQWEVGDWLACWLGGWLAGGMFAGCLSGRAGWLANWLAACPAGRQAGKLDQKSGSRVWIVKMDRKI